MPYQELNIFTSTSLITEAVDKLHSLSRYGNLCQGETVRRRTVSRHGCHAGLVVNCWPTVLARIFAGWKMISLKSRKKFKKTYVLYLLSNKR